MTINELCKVKAEEVIKFYRFCEQSPEVKHINKVLLQQLMRSYMDALQYRDKDIDPPLDSKTFLAVIVYLNK